MSGVWSCKIDGGTGKPVDLCGAVVLCCVFFVGADEVYEVGERRGREIVVVRSVRGR